MAGRAFFATMLGVGLVACSLGDWSSFTGGEKDLTDGSTSDGGGVADSGARDAEAGALPDPYGDEVRKDGPVAWYRLEDDLGGSTITLVDSIGPHHATADGPISPAPGISGRGVLLGGDTSLVVGDVFDFAGRVPFAFEVWVQASSSPYDQRFVSKRENAGAMPGYIAYLGGDRTPHFEAWGVGMSAWSDSPVSTSYTHIVISVSYATGKGNATLWIDGQRAPQGGFDNTDALANTSVPLVFGESLRGAIDEIAIYDKELSEDRVLAHYRAGRP